MVGFHRGSSLRMLDTHSHIDLYMQQLHTSTFVQIVHESYLWTVCRTANKKVVAIERRHQSLLSPTINNINTHQSVSIHQNPQTLVDLGARNSEDILGHDNSEVLGSYPSRRRQSWSAREIPIFWILGGTAKWILISLIILCVTVSDNWFNNLAYCMNRVTDSIIEDIGGQ